MLFFIDEDHKGRLMISESCQTRLQNIKKISWYDEKKYKAFSIPINKLDGSSFTSPRDALDIFLLMIFTVLPNWQKRHRMTISMMTLLQINPGK